MAKRQGPRRLFRGNDFVSLYEVGSSPRKQMGRMADEHLDVLQNIESVLVTAYRETNDVDDSAAAEALPTLTRLAAEDARISLREAALAAAKRIKGE